MNKKSSVRIAAWIGIVLLAVLYAATLVVAIIDFENSKRLFNALVIADIALPILIWIYIWIFKQVQERKAEAEAFRNFSDCVKIAD